MLMSILGLTITSLFTMMTTAAAVTESPADVCNPDPCQHGGLCVDEGVDVYTCDCRYGYTGLNCHIGTFTVIRKNSIRRLYHVMAGSDVWVKIPLGGSNPPNEFQLLRYDKEMGRVQGVSVKWTNVTRGSGEKEEEEEEREEKGVVDVNIYTTDPEHSGSYTLVMKNSDGINKTFDFRVEVQTEKIRFKHRNMTVVIITPGMDHTISVLVVGAPLPQKFVLRKDRKEFEHGSSFQLNFTRSNDSVGVLRVRIFKLPKKGSYSGTYSVQMTNANGDSAWYGFHLTLPVKRAMAGIDDFAETHLLTLIITGIGLCVIGVVVVVLIIRNGRTTMATTTKSEGNEMDAREEEMAADVETAEKSHGGARVRFDSAMNTCVEVEVDDNDIEFTSVPSTDDELGAHRSD